MKRMVQGIMRDLDAEKVRYDARTAQIIAASEALADAEIARICAVHELEPDEFYTREQKAQEYIA